MAGGPVPYPTFTLTLYVGWGVFGVWVRVCEGLEGRETPGGFAQGLLIVLNSFHFINNLLL